MGTIGETIDYEDASPEVARLFDAALDNVCYAEAP